MLSGSATKSAEQAKGILARLKQKHSEKGTGGLDTEEKGDGGMA